MILSQSLKFFVTHSGAAGKLRHDNTNWLITNTSLVTILSSDVKGSRPGPIEVHFLLLRESDTVKHLQLWFSTRGPQDKLKQLKIKIFLSLIYL